MRSLIACVLMFALYPAPSAAQDNLPRRNVLALFWDGPEFPSYTAMKRGILAGFQSAPLGTLQYHEEYLESGRFPGPKYPQVFADYLAAKYADRHIDLVLCITTASLNFLLDHDTLFPDAAIVFSTSRPPRRQPSRATGLIYSQAYGETVATARRLHPGAKRLFVISGTAERDRRLEMDVRGDLERLGIALPATYWTDRPVPELVEQVKRLSEDSLVLLLPQAHDQSGAPVLPQDVQEQVAKASGAPVYGTANHDVGHGIVGGFAVSAEQYGTLLADVAERVLDGTPPSAVAVAAAPVVPMFDWRQLRRWRLSESQLPAGSTVLFRPASLWQLHPFMLVGGLSLFCVESALVAGLLILRGRRRRAEGALRASEARYRGVVETQTELICRCLPDTTLTFVNDAYCRFWGKRREDLVGAKFIEMIPEEERADFLRRFSAIVVGGGELRHEHEVLLGDGSIGWQHWVNQPLVGPDGRVSEIQATGRDITQRRRAENALRSASDALQISYQRVEDLAGRLIASQEAERKRIARDLHDDLSQKLALLCIDIDQIPGHQSSELEARVRQISGRAAEIASDVHRLAYELHPSKLESLGLVAALSSVCRDVSRQHNVQVQFEQQQVPDDVPSDIALCLYRIVQEGLHNIVRHSGARQALVQLRASDDALELHIADSGMGFAASEHGSGGIGLISMRERVNFVGGEIAIHSAPGAGTRIGVRVPSNRVPDPLHPSAATTVRGAVEQRTVRRVS